MCRPRNSSTIAGLLLLMMASHGPSMEAAQQNAPTKSEPETSRGFKEFTDRVHAYVNVHKSAASGVPGGKPTDLPEVIAARQLALARKIREARPNAKTGDIFSEEATKEFRAVIEAQFNGPEGRNMRTTIRQGEPVPGLQLKVNQPYPRGTPITTVPPDLLLKLPKLPDVVEYRIVDRDFVLLDVEANLVVDVIPGALPRSVETR